MKTRINISVDSTTPDRLNDLAETCRRSRSGLIDLFAETVTAADVAALEHRRLTGARSPLPTARTVDNT